MRAEERIEELEAQTRNLREQLAQALEQLDQALSRIQELEGQLAKDSHNSSKPPSSDGPRHKRHRQRPKSEQPSGGQPGHAGHRLMPVASPDEIVRHRPGLCDHCQQPLEGIDGEVKDRRQIHDLPQVRLLVQEHQVEEVCCPACQHMSRGSFPPQVPAPVQYGPKLRALAVYLHEYQWLPLGRVSELLGDCYGAWVCEATVQSWVEIAAERLAPVVAQIADWLSTSRLQHADETGIRIAGKGHWLHVTCTRFLTHLAWHVKRRRAALQEIGIWPRFRGRAMHDRWASYDHYPCAHSLCGAHLVRDCLYVAEQEAQEWAAEMADLLLSMAKAASQWRQQGARAMPTEERDSWVAHYFELLARGYAAQPLPSAQDVPKPTGRRKQSAAKNLLDAFLRRADQVLAFLDDLSISFTNNQAERDLRMAKVQQKVSGTFRSEGGATAFCRIRSYLSTMRKQGQNMLLALAAVFEDHPLPLAWAPQ